MENLPIILGLSLVSFIFIIFLVYKMYKGTTIKPITQETPQENGNRSIRGLEHLDSDDSTLRKRIMARKGKKYEEKQKLKEERRKLLQEEKEMREAKQKQEKKEEEKLEAQKNKEEQQQALEQQHILEAEQKRRKEREEMEKKEYEDWKNFIEVEEAGSYSDDRNAMETRNAEFIEYICANKVVQLEDLALKFGIKMPDVIEKIQKFEAQGKISGIIGDRAKYIFISLEEMKHISKTIQNRGRLKMDQLNAICTQTILKK